MGTMSEEALVYLNEALDYLQGHSVRRDQIDWPALRHEVYALAADAQTTTQTYPAIELALKLLGDQHSFFSTPEERELTVAGKIKRAGMWMTVPAGVIGMIDAGSPAEHAGVQVGERVETVNGQPFSALTREQRKKIFGGDDPIDLTLIRDGEKSSRLLRLQPSVYEIKWLPHGRRLEHNIGYLHLPGNLGAGNPEYRKAYTSTLQQLIRELDQSAIYGWIIDIRRNVGGSMWPMWAGIGSISGEGEIVSFVSPGERLKAIYRDGRAFMEPGELADEVEDPYALKRSEPPVAVLTSPLTGSAGEFVAMGFCGRPQTRSFGERTAGVPTGNDSKFLSDGAVIALTAYLGVDRTGRVYDSSLLPDHPVQIDWSILGTDDDPVIQAAMQWLSIDEGCL